MRIPFRNGARKTLDPENDPKFAYSFKRAESALLVHRYGSPIFSWARSRSPLCNGDDDIGVGRKEGMVAAAMRRVGREA